MGPLELYIIIVTKLLNESKINPELYLQVMKACKDCLFSLAEVSEFEQYLPILLGILQTDESDVCVMQVLSKVTFTAWCTYNYVEMYMYRISILTGVQVSSG